MTGEGNLVVTDAVNLRATTYAAPDFKTIIATTRFGGNVSYPIETALRRGDREIWAVSDSNEVLRYSYPSGGLPSVTIMFEPPHLVVTIAVAPCARPNC
jgi:hypothetical protein